jgi:hypothetical protein
VTRASLVGLDADGHQVSGSADHRPGYASGERYGRSANRWRTDL